MAIVYDYQDFPFRNVKQLQQQYGLTGDYGVSGLLADLKKRGYHVIMETTPQQVANSQYAYEKLNGISKPGDKYLVEGNYLLVVS